MTKAEALKIALEKRGFKSVPTRQPKNTRRTVYLYKMVGELEWNGRKEKGTYWITENASLHVGDTIRSARCVVQYFYNQLLYEGGYVE